MPEPALEARLSDPGFTPGKRELAAVFDVLCGADETLAEQASRALSRAREAALRPALARLATAPALGRRRLVRLLSRLAAHTQDPELQSALLERLADPDPPARRLAMVALGKLRAPEVEAALLAALPAASSAERRAIVEALGKIGSARSLAALTELPESDPELARVLERARLMLERSLERSPSRIVLDRTLDRALPVVVSCRAGLSEILADELAGLGARRRSADSVELRFSGTLGALLVARTATEFALELALPDAPSLEEAVALTLTDAVAVDALRRWTEGRPTFRLALPGGHRRQSVFRTAGLVRSRTDVIGNDPREATWDARVDETARTLRLIPRRYDDPRFAHRRADVPAASHPSVAAALARVAGVQSDDVVWDPFCGSGLELIERGLLGSYRRLIGSDVDPGALGAAEQNLRAAALADYELHAASATRFAPRDVSLIITNPPMGRRVARGRAPELLLEFLKHARGVLSPRGRLVWLSPLGREQARHVRALGWSVARGRDVDLGGFSAELQVLRRA